MSKSNRAVLRVETLEDRRLLTTFGIPWPEPRALSISFPSDTANIGHYDNSMREVFDQVADRKEWQEAVLRSFQTWASKANINIGLVPDRGDDFGTIGLTSADPRFGEFRIGAFPQTVALANAAPYQQAAGTWAGDVLLNTNINYFLGDWASGNPIEIPDPGDKGPPVELFSVLLHEAGNALGLADNNIQDAVMNGTYSGPNGTLKNSDIRAIRNLYGGRRDIYETSNNNTRARAIVVQQPPGYRGREPISVPGSLNSNNDVDFYRISPLRNAEKLNVRLFAAGISLVKAKVEVFDRYGNLIGDVKADSVFDNNLEIEIGSLNDVSRRALFVKVSRNTDDVFAIGDYRLDFDYRPYDQQPPIAAPIYDADADDDDSNDLIEYVSVDGLFAQAGILDSEVGSNDTLQAAIPLETTLSFLDNTRYEILSSMSGSADRDVWKFRAPAFSSPVLRINVDPVGLENPELETVVLNAAGDRLATQVVRKSDGGSELIVLTPQPNAEVFLFVRTAETSEFTEGNYVVVADFATTPVDEPTDVFAATVSRSDEHLSKLSIGRTQLLRFDLSTVATTADDGMQLTIYNARTGDEVATMAVQGNSTKSNYIWLGEGEFVLRASYLSRAGSSNATTSFSLSIDSLSDDQGPTPIDSTLPPLPEFSWEPLPITQLPPIININEPPFENPWTSDFVDDFYQDYYDERLA